MVTDAFCISLFSLFVSFVHCQEAYLMLGSCLEKVNDTDGAIAAYLKVCPGCGASPAMIVDACLTAGQVAQENHRLDTAKTAYESALKVLDAVLTCCVVLNEGNGVT
jgi:hypothetical protein